MTTIDLKHATVYVEDGYSGPSGGASAKVNNASGYSAGAFTMAVDGIVGSVVTGDRFTVAGDTVQHAITAHTQTSPTGTPLVNNVAGYSAGVSTILVDGFTGAVATGDTFTIAGDTTVYAVTAHTETLGNTTSITFTPTLAVTVADDVAITWIGHTTSITFTPALGSPAADDADIDWLPHQLEVVMGEGNLTYDESRNMDYKLNRGNLDDVKEGDQIPMDIKLDGSWSFLRSSSGDPPTFEEAIKKIGGASGWVTSDSANPCRPYAVNLIIDHVPPCGDVESERIVLPDYRWEKLAHDPKAGTISTTGKCNATQAEVSRY